MAADGYFCGLKTSYFFNQKEHRDHRDGIKEMENALILIFF